MKSFFFFSCKVENTNSESKVIRSCAETCALVIHLSTICKLMSLTPKFLKALRSFLQSLKKEQVTKMSVFMYMCVGGVVRVCANIQLMT